MHVNVNLNVHVNGVNAGRNLGAGLPKTPAMAADATQLLSFERLDVYRCSIEFLALVAPALDTLPRGNAVLAAAMESAAILDCCRVLQVLDLEQVRAGKALLGRLVAMLTKMTR